MRYLASLVALLASAAVPLSAQFAITVQQNGQATATSSGGTITINAPAVGQAATATVTVTYVGTGSVSFLPATILGATSFTGAPGAVTLASLQSTTFTLSYTPTATAQATAQFQWLFTQFAVSSAGVATPVSTGAVTFNLVGTAPNVVFGQVPATNGFVPVPNGGTFQFPATLVGATSNLTMAISNTGSGAATINSITATGAGFQFQSVPLLPLTLNAGSQLNLVLQLSPTAAGTQTGSIQIAMAGGTYTANLSGNAVTTFLSYQLTQDGKTSPFSPGQTITFDPTAVGSQSTVVLQFQNTGTTNLTLSTFAVSGSGYSIIDGPFIPVTLQPQQSNTITIAYTPVQGATTTAGRLLIGTDTFLLAAAIQPASFAYQLTQGGTTSTVTPGQTITFPQTSVGSQSRAILQFQNTGTTPLTLSTFAIEGSGFSITDGPFLPITLQPLQSNTITLTYAPVQGATTTTGRLIIGADTFNLAAVVSATLPAYSFTGASGTQQPFQQPAIGLTLAAPYAAALNGTITLTVAPVGFAADPAVQFSGGGRQVTFTIPANTTQAVFANGATQIRFQTGTVASTLTFTPAFTLGTAPGTDITPTNPLKLQITVPSLAPTLLTAAFGSVTNAGFSVVITGYSTTRSLDHLTFQFTPAAGSALGTTTATVDLTGAATVWFSGTTSQSLGGEFTVTVPFTLSNGTTVTAATNLSQSVASVSVTAANGLGTSNSISAIVP